MALSYVDPEAAHQRIGYPVSTSDFLDTFVRSWNYTNPDSNPFSADRSENYTNIAILNLNQLGNILPPKLYGKVTTLSLSPEESQECALLVEKTIFNTTYEDFPNIGTLLQERRLTEVKDLNKSNVERITESKKELVAEAVEKGIMTLLVRPEIYQLRDLVKTFITENGFDVRFSRDTNIDFAHYWALYNHAFDNSCKEAHIRRRAFGYINRPCHLILFTDPTNRYGKDSRSLADGIKRDYKGIPGAYDPQTLRGGIIYAEMTMAMMGFDHSTSLALDPLLQYHYSDPSIYASQVRSHVLANLPGIHIPEGDEIEKDLGILLERDELLNL